MGWGGPRAVTRLPTSPTDTTRESPPAPWQGSPGPQAAAPSCPFPTPSLLDTLQVGEDVPDARKCACASHVAKVAEFFQVRVGPGLVGAGPDLSRGWVSVLVVVLEWSQAA